MVAMPVDSGSDYQPPVQRGTGRSEREREREGGGERGRERERERGRGRESERETCFRPCKCGHSNENSTRRKKAKVTGS